jgi:hypothetical protein
MTMTVDDNMTIWRYDDDDDDDDDYDYTTNKKKCHFGIEFGYCCVLLFFFLLNNTEYSIIMLFADGFSILSYLFSLNFCYSTMHKGR